MSSNLSQRFEALGREHDDGKARKKIEIAIDHAQADFHRHERGRYRCEKFEDGPREEGDVQRFHRCASICVSRTRRRGAFSRPNALSVDSPASKSSNWSPKRCMAFSRSLE